MEKPKQTFWPTNTMDLVSCYFYLKTHFKLYSLWEDNQSFCSICTPCPSKYTLGQVSNDTLDMFLSLPIDRNT